MPQCKCAITGPIMASPYIRRLLGWVGLVSVCSAPRDALRVLQMMQTSLADDVCILIQALSLRIHKGY